MAPPAPFLGADFFSVAWSVAPAWPLPEALAVCAAERNVIAKSMVKHVNSFFMGFSSWLQMMNIVRVHRSQRESEALPCRSQIFQSERRKPPELAGLAHMVDLRHNVI